jgi:two-component system sensor histidine kinase/response regulator
MIDFVTKPIDPDHLWRTLHRWIKLDSGPAAGSASTPVSAEIAGVLNLPDDIPGLDTTAGLKCVLGNRQSYLSILKKFVISQKDTPQQIKAALVRGDRNTAERLAHTLKGLAGSIGAAGLQSSAGHLEAAIESDQAPEIVEKLQTAQALLLDALVAGLEGWFPAEAAKEQPLLVVDQTTLVPVCENLARLLARDNPEAGDLLDANADLLRTAFSDGYAEIEDRIREFDFDTALAALQRQAKALGMDL